MPSFAKLGKAAGVALGFTAGVAGLGALAALRRPLPRKGGMLPIPGLSAPVKVYRDRWGVPHIYARNTADLFTAQGYVHAQDRLWQMELHRRTGHGQLAEVLGPVALDSDRFIRVLGFGRVARREAALLEGRTRAAIEAYVHGINTFLAQNARRLPIEFTLLRLRPRPWDSADVLVWGKIMALTLSENWKFEILRARIVATVGAERAAAVEPGYAAEHPLIIPRGVRYGPDIGEDALRAAAAVEPFTGGDASGQGSNAWVVSGTRSASAMPLLANDMHLSLQMPSLWYENHLNAGDYHVTGASIPGSPGVIVGHNERIAWGVTNGMTDVQDLYIEKFDPADPTRYEFRGAWEQAEIVREPIVVRGQDAPVVEEVRITRHGPIVSSLVASTATNGTADEQALAMRWTALEPGRIVSAILGLNLARDWDEFRAALADWTAPAQNFVYADVEGHIGYSFAGDLPIRANGDGRLPVPGWTGEYEWTGTIPPAELPHMFDPDEGLVVTANNRVIGDDYPYTIMAEWLSGYRAARIRQLLEATPAHDSRSFGRIHADQYSLPGQAFTALAARLPITSVTAQHARDALAAWDGDLAADSVGGAIYARLREKLLLGAHADITGPLATITGKGLFASLVRNDYFMRVMPNVLQRIAHGEDRWLPAGRTWDDVLGEAWAATVRELRDEYGDDVREWRYGRFHSLTFRHPLSAVPALKPLFNRGPFPTGGDIDTVSMGHRPREFAGLPFYVAPSYRQICDLADWDRSRSIHPTGQSGHPGSRHYADFIRPWLKVQYHPMLWTRARVEEAAASQVTLEPAS